MALLSAQRPNVTRREWPTPGRWWKIDVNAIDPDALPNGRIERSFAFDRALQARGLVVSERRGSAPEEGTIVDGRGNRFAALNLARREGGASIRIPKGVALEEPIVVRQGLGEGLTLPYTLVVAGEGSRATVISRLEGGAGEALASEIVEIVVEEGAELTFVAVQSLAAGARIFSSRHGKLEANATLHWALAELGAGLCAGDVRSLLEARGGETSLSGVFFPAADQHVDLQTEVDHRAGDSFSETLFKSAATGRGQARFLGNIRIEPGAHGTEATLRDDALLLSKSAHIDSIPALEIGANDVKAFHGATVGAIDEDEIFYAMSRGIERGEAERMIALGFFEPALVRFPGEGLRDELRAALAEKLS